MAKNKARLVMDMPNSCDVCPLVRMIGNNFICTPKENSKKVCSVYYYVKNDKKPDWCPLRELPQKQTVHCTDTTHHRFAKDGWNACVDTILKAVAEVKNFVEYKHPNGYSARLYGDSSMCIYFSGKEILHTGSRNVNTETEVMKMLEDYPNLWSSLSNNIDEILADNEDSEV